MTQAGTCCSPVTRPIRSSSCIRCAPTRSHQTPRCTSRRCGRSSPTAQLTRRSTCRHMTTIQPQGSQTPPRPQGPRSPWRDQIGNRNSLRQTGRRELRDQLVPWASQTRRSLTGYWTIKDVHATASHTSLLSVRHGHFGRVADPPGSRGPHGCRYFDRTSAGRLSGVLCSWRIPRLRSCSGRDLRCYQRGSPGGFRVRTVPPSQSIGRAAIGLRSAAAC